MGRHETFENAAPIADELLASTMLGRQPALDPIDAVIGRHRTAHEDLRRATESVDAAMNASKQVEEGADAAFDAASARESAAWAELLAARPSDMPRVMRLLRYVSTSPASEVVEDPQDLLRQITAAVASGAHTGAVTVGEAGEHVEPDPVFAVAAEYRAAWDNLEAVIDAAGVDDADGPTHEALSVAYDRLRAVRPTTPAGYRALAETWAWRLLEERATPATGLIEVGTVGGHAADSLIAGAVVCVPPASDPDPALFAIERHRRARAAWEPHLHAISDQIVGSPAYVAAEAAGKGACREDEEAFEALVVVRPTTPAGLRALADYLPGALARNGTSTIDGDDERVLHSLRDGVLAVIPPAPDKSDPVLAKGDHAHVVIAEHRVAYAAWKPLGDVWNEAVGTEATDAAQAAQAEPSRVEIEAFERLIDTRASTVAGLVALAAYLPSAVLANSVSDPDTDAMRALRSMCNGVLALVAADLPEDDGAPDPVLAAIAASRHAEAEMAAFQDSLSHRITRAQRQREDALGEVQNATRQAAWNTVPTTHAGRVALVDFARFQVEVDRGPDGRVSSPESLLMEILDALGSAIAAEQPEPPARPGASNLHTPIGLIEAITTAWAALAAVENGDDQKAFDRAYERRDALLDAADSLPATSREAVLAKALALAWVSAVELLGRGDRARDSYGTDGRLAFDVDAWLTSGARAVSAPARPSVPGGYDLGSLTVAQLARLHETVNVLWRVAGSFTNAPFSWDGRRQNHSPLGRIIDRETERLAEFHDAITAEIRQRQPVDADERDERLATVVTHSIICNGLVEDRALVAEVAAAWGG